MGDVRPHLAAWLSVAPVAACSGGTLAPPARTAEAAAWEELAHVQIAGNRSR